LILLRKMLNKMHKDISKEGSLEVRYPYLNSHYDSKKRFCSYWHQVNEVISMKPMSVLEIGVGNGFVTRYLREKGISVTTLDVVHELNPNVAGSVLRIPFADKTFDVVSCYEVLEHLPYSQFGDALGEIHRVSQKRVNLSLPDVTTSYRIYLELPRFDRPIKKLIAHPFPRPSPHEYDGEHYWEIGKIGYSLNRIRLAIENRKFRIVKTYRVFEWPYHRFFVLEKS